MFFIHCRRHKEEVKFGPVLHPVRFSDTAFIYLNSTKKRFVSRTFYEARVKPKSYAVTTYNNPKTLDERYVSYLDFNKKDNKKWFKTSVELKARKFTSAQVIREPVSNNNYLDYTTTTTKLSSTPAGYDFKSKNYPNGLGFNEDRRMNFGQYPGQGKGGETAEEKYDPGASQIYIPKPLHRSIDDQSLYSGDLLLNFSNRKVDFNMNGPLNGYSDV